MTITLEAARQLLAAQPLSEMLGARLEAFSPELTELVVPLSAGVRQQHGAAHGGLVSYTVDTAMTFAAGAAGGAGVLTAELKLNYVRGATGHELVARASVVHCGSALVVTRCDVFDRRDDGERLCAVAQGTCSRLRT